MKMEPKTQENRPTTTAVLAFALSLALIGTFTLAQTLEVELQRAIQTETITGDLKAAIDTYAKIAARAGTNRAVAAHALLRLAHAHQKLGDAESRQIYERIIREFADQQVLVAEARSRLATFDSPSVASKGRAARQLWVGMDVDTLGSVSADGRYLSYTDWSTGDLAVRDFVAGTSRRLTNTGGWEKSGDFAEFSIVSPDGRSIAYAWFEQKPPGAPTFYDLRLISTTPGAGSARVIHQSAATTWIRPCAFTPDGKHVLVVRAAKRDENELAMVAIADGSVRSLKHFGQPVPSRVSISPDGRFIAYDKVVSTARGTRDVFLLPLGGGDEVPIVQSASDDKQPLWSPDGSKLLFVSDRSGVEALWAIEVRDGKPRGRAESLSADVGPAVLGLTAAGGLVHVKGGSTRNVYIADIGGDLKSTGKYEVLSERIVNVNSTPAWSPDGESVAYYSSRGNQDLIGSTLLVIRSMKSGEEQEIPLAIRVPTIHQTGLRWFPDGKSLLVVGRDVATPARTFYKFDIASGKLDALKQINGRGIPGNQPQITPDGRSLIYADGGERLVRFEIASGQETQLIEGWFGSLSLSPDGTQLAFVGNVVNSDFRFNQLVVMPIVGGGERRVLFESTKWNDGSRFNSIGWSHDQKYVLFARDGENKGGNSLWRVPASGGPAEQTGIVVTGRIKAPSVHPRGGKLTFSAVNEAPQEVWILENFLPQQ